MGILHLVAFSSLNMSEVVTDFGVLLFTLHMIEPDEGQVERCPT